MGTRLATGGRDGTVRLWEPTSGREILTLNRHYGGVTSVRFSADGNYLYTFCNFQMVCIWDGTPR